MPVKRKTPAKTAKPTVRATRSKRNANPLLLKVTRPLSRRVGLAFLAAFVLVGGYTLYAASHAATPEFALARNNLCLDDYRDLTANNSTVDVWTCNGSAAQRWVKNGNAVMVNGKCLDAYRWGTTDGTRVDLYACTGGANQQWYWRTAAHGYELVNLHANKCLDDTAYGNSGTHVELYTCTGGTNQLWKNTFYSGSSSTPSPTPTVSNPTPTPTASSSTPTPTPTPVSSSTQPVGIAGTWNMAFDDEFNGTALNTKYWSPSWFNGGKVNNDNGVYMNASNVQETGGNLILTLASSTSGATVDTDPSQDTGGSGFTFGTGYVAEARMYVPGSGSTIYNWPAWWTDGQNWPTTGESDIFEGLGTATSNYHSPLGANNSGTIAGTWSNSWHTYALDREPGKDYIYWDGRLVRSYSSDDGGAPQYLIFSHDCSGGCVTGAQLKVDYVRVWKKG